MTFRLPFRHSRLRAWEFFGNIALGHTSWVGRASGPSFRRRRKHTMNQPLGLMTGGTPVPPKKASDRPELARPLKKFPGSARE